MQHSFSPNEYFTQRHTACVIKPKMKEHETINIFIPTGSVLLCLHLGEGSSLGSQGIV